VVAKRSCEPEDQVVTRLVRKQKWLGGREELSWVVEEARLHDGIVGELRGANLLPSIARSDASGLATVVLDQGGVAYTTDEGTGRVALAVHPWEISLAAHAPTDSAVNHLQTPVLPLA
jgi:hypothetical protein